MGKNSKKKIKIHTNTIENLWSRLKRKSKEFYGIHWKNLSGVVDECMLLLDLKCYNQKTLITWLNIMKEIDLKGSHNQPQVYWHEDQRKKKKKIQFKKILKDDN